MIKFDPDVKVLKIEIEEIKNDIHEIKESIKKLESKFNNVHKIDKKVEKIEVELKNCEKTLRNHLEWHRDINKINYSMSERFKTGLIVGIIVAIVEFCIKYLRFF